VAGDLGTLTLDVRAKLDQLDRDLDGAKASARKAGDEMGENIEKRMGSRLDGTKAKIGALGGALASAGIAAGFHAAGDAARTFQDRVSGAASILQADYAALAAQARDFRFIPPSVAAQAQQEFAVVGKALGMTGDAGVELSRKLLETSQAMTVVTGIPIAEVTNGISAAFRGEYDSLQRLIPGLNGATIETKALEMTGKENASALTDQEKAQAVLNAVLESGADYQSKLAENTGTAAAKQKETAAAADAASISLGDRMLPIMAKVSEVAGKAANVFGDLPGPIQTVVLALGGLLILAGPIASLITLFGVLGPAIAAISLPVVAVVAAIAALIAIGYVLYRNWDTLKEWAGIVWHGIRDTVGGAWESLKNIVMTGTRFIVDTFLAGVEWIVRGAARALGWIPGAGSKLREAAEKFEGFRDEVNAALGGIRDKHVTVDVALTQHRGSGGGMFMASGGLVPGVGSTDSVPIWGMPGEYMIKKKAVQHYGLGFFDAVNAERFAEGGLVGLSGRTPDVGPFVGTLDRTISDLARQMAEEWAASLPRLGATFGGLNPEFLRRFQAWNASLGGILSIVSGWRSRAEQEYLYGLYLAGVGNLAAVPGTSMHEKGLAIDHAPAWWGMDQQGAWQFGLHHPVPGEPWHVEPFDRGGWLKPGLTLAYTGTGLPEAVLSMANGGLVQAEDGSWVPASFYGPPAGGVNPARRSDVWYRRQSAEMQAGYMPDPYGSGGWVPRPASSWPIVAPVDKLGEMVRLSSRERSACRCGPTFIIHGSVIAERELLRLARRASSDTRQTVGSSGLG
jgi:hypothetical protein